MYAELQRHFDREEEARNQAVIELARRNHLPLLATNGVCHATAARREVSDVFTCIRNHVRLETAGRLLARNSECYLKPGATMQKIIKHSTAAPPDISQRAAVPEPLASLIMACLRKTPEERPHATEMLEQLLAAERNENIKQLITQSLERLRAAPSQ